MSQQKSGPGQHANAMGMAPTSKTGFLNEHIQKPRDLLHAHALKSAGVCTTVFDWPKKEGVAKLRDLLIGQANTFPCELDQVTSPVTGHGIVTADVSSLLMALHGPPTAGAAAPLTDPDLRASGREPLDWVGTAEERGPLPFQGWRICWCDRE